MPSSGATDRHCVLTSGCPACLDGPSGRTVVADLCRLFRCGHQAGTEVCAGRVRPEASARPGGAWYRWPRNPRASIPRIPEPPKLFDRRFIDVYRWSSARGNPNPVWGVLLRQGPPKRELFGGEPNTTNNRTEMMAVIEALVALKRPLCSHACVDNQYVLKGMTEWLPAGRPRAGGPPPSSP